MNALKRADWTPLMLAATRPDCGCVAALLAAGALPRLVNKDGWTAAQVAARAGHQGVLELLLNAEPRLTEQRSRTGRTLLHTAGERRPPLLHSGGERRAPLLYTAGERRAPLLHSNGERRASLLHSGGERRAPLPPQWR